MTAKQEREATQSLTSSRPPPPRAPGYQTRDTGLATGGIEQPEDDPLGETANSPRCKPKCALYFSSLIKANWDQFGVAPSDSEPPSSNGMVNMFSFLVTYEAKHVYDSLESRLSLIELGKQYTKIMEDGMSTGMTAENARSFASRKMIYEAGKGHGHEVGVENESQRSDKFIRQVDNMISLALGWKTLCDVIGVPEILLVDFDEDDAYHWEDDIPIPRITLTSDHENTCPLPELLSPRLGLKETCLKLNGVVSLMKRLKGLEERSELRAFLAGEIQWRVQDVFGDPSDYHFGQECDTEEDVDGDSDEDDESMPDAKSTPNIGEIHSFNYYYHKFFAQHYGE